MAKVRSAKSGKYVSKAVAKANPDTTVAENDYCARRLRQICRAWVNADTGKFEELMARTAKRLKITPNP